MRSRYDFSLAAHFLHPRVAFGGDQTYEDMKMLVEVMNLIRDNYVQDVTPRNWCTAPRRHGEDLALLPIFGAGRPQGMKTETEGEFGGLGIRIAIRDGSDGDHAVAGHAAYRMGIIPNDRVLKINGDTTQDITIEQAVKKTARSPGSKITLTDRPGAWKGKKN